MPVPVNLLCYDYVYLVYGLWEFIISALEALLATMRYIN